MKKVLKRLSALTLLLLALSLLFACGQSSGGNDDTPPVDDYEHAHDFCEWYQDSANDPGLPICESWVTFRRDCATCGFYETREDYLDHEIEYVDGKSATCLEDGYSDHERCSRCGEEYGKEIYSSSSYYHVTVEIPPVPAGYGHDGLTEGYKCSLCGTVIEEQEVVYGTYDLNVEVSTRWNESAYLESIVSPVNSGRPYSLAASSSQHRFLGWFNGDLLIGTDYYLIYNMPSSHTTLTARYAEYGQDDLVLTVGEKYHAVTVTAGEGGKAELVDYLVKYGDELTVSAICDNGYAVAGWYNGDELLGTGNSLTFTPEESLDLHVVFGKADYSVSVTTDDHVTVSGLEDAYTLGERVTLNAILEEGYELDGWYLGGERVAITNEYSFVMGYENVALEVRRKPVLASEVTLEGGDSVDVDSGELTLSVIVTPSNADYSDVKYSIVSGADATGAALDGNKLTFSSPGEVKVKVSLYDKYGAIVSEHDVIVYIFSTHVGSIEIVNEDNVILAGESAELALEVYPPTAFPRGEYQYQLVKNTCGATVSEDGILSVTQPGSVRIRVRVDDSDWSEYYEFHVPVPVSSPEEFYAIHDNLGGYYVLESDIDLSGYPEWHPIGYAENTETGLTYDKAFKGYLNGNGHKITGLNIDVSKTNYLTVGLFGAIDNSARVIDLTVEDYRIYGDCASSIVYLGGIAGIVNGAVRDVSVSGVVETVGARYVGGAVGQLFGELSGSDVDVELYVGSSVASSIRIGGAVGYFANGTFSDCSVGADLTVVGAFDAYVGSVVGEADGKITDVELTRSELSVNVGGTSYVGSYAGKVSYVLLEGISVTGNIHASAEDTLYIGGVVGHASSIKNSSFSGSISFGNVESVYAGGVVGYALGDLSELTQSVDSVKIVASGSVHFGSIAGYSKGSVSGSDSKMQLIDVTSTASTSSYSVRVGGIVAETLGSVSYCDFIGNITVSSGVALGVGGIAGVANGASYCNAYSIITTESTPIATSSSMKNYNSVGGIVGYSSGAVTETYFYGRMKVTFNNTDDYSEAYVGGTVGCADNEVSSSVTSAVIDVNSDADLRIYVGGIAGYATQKITDTKTDGDITVNADYLTYVGGIAGLSHGISRSYAIGDLSAVSEGELYIGGISAYTLGGIDQCYYSYGDISGISSKTVYSGGIAAYLSSNIKNSYTSYSYILTDISKKGTKAYLGGIVGYVSRGEVIDCYTMCFVDGRADGSSKTLYVGGIVGYNDSGTVMRCFTESAGAEYIRENLDISDIETTALNSAAVYAGGLVGYNVGKIESCYSKNSLLTRNSFAGGLVGYNNSSIKYCISYSTILGILGEKVGCFVGNSASGASYVDCYYLLPSKDGGNAVGTGVSEGILGKTTAELRGTTIYANYDAQYWIIVNGKQPRLAFSSDIWGENESLGYYQLKEVLYPLDQHSYPEPDTYREIIFDAGEESENPPSMFIHEGEGTFVTAIPSRIGYIFGGWYYDRELNSRASDSEIIIYEDTTLYAKWIPIIYSVTTESDGRGETSASSDEYIYKDTVTLTATDKPGDYVFAGWYQDGALVSQEKTYTFTAPASDTVFVAVFLDCYELDVNVNSALFGYVTDSSDSGRGTETEYYSFSAIAKTGYTFFGWFIDDQLISRESEISFRMPSEDVKLTARFVSAMSEPEVWDGSVADSFFGGSGTESDPYIISSAAELAWLARQVNNVSGMTFEGVYFALANDIYLGERSWTPIGNTKTYQNQGFAGVFDGCGHTVFGGYSNDGNYLGLFGYLTGTVKNVSVIGYRTGGPSSYKSGGIYAGGIAGFSSGTVRNCFASVDINASTSYSMYCGGIVGSSTGSVIACISAGDVYSYTSGNYQSSYAGGIAGLSSGSISDCVSFANVRANSYNSGSHSACVGAICGSDAVETYRYELQQIIERYDDVPVAEGTVIIPASISAEELVRFYLGELGFNPDAWNFTVIADGALYPTLLPTYRQIYVTAEHGETSVKDALANAITVAATADRGYRFVGWYLDGKLLSDSATLRFTPRTEATLEARFEIVNYTLAVEDNYNNGGAEKSTALYHYKDRITLTARTVEGFEFLGWYIGDELVSSELVATLRMPDADTVAVARYGKYFTLSVEAGEGYGSVTGGCSVYETGSATVSAVANEGYRFFGWFAGDRLVSTDAEYTLSMPSGNYKLTARFTAATEYINDSVWDGTVAKSFGGGKGTEESPYLISNGAELAFLAHTVKSGADTAGKYFVLTADIDLGEKSWTPIGATYSEGVNTVFKGHFEGNGYTVKGLNPGSIELNSVYVRGLFGSTSPDATVRNLNVEVVANYAIAVECVYYFGSVVADHHGLIENCHVTGTITTSHKRYSDPVYYGGIVGRSYGTVKGCSADITANVEIYEYGSYVGGLIGYAEAGSTVDSCFSEGTLTVTHDGMSSSSKTCAGGLIAYSRASVTRSYSEVSVTHSNSDGYHFSPVIGGLIGLSSGEISDCYATGDVKSYGFDAYCGGLVGINYGSVTRSFATGNVLAASYVSSYSAFAGGLIGMVEANSGEIKDCFAFGNVTSSALTLPNAYAGALVGSVTDETLIVNCYYYGDQVIEVNGEISPTNTVGIISTLDTLNSESFYNSIGFAESTWSFIGAELSSGKHPTLLLEAPEAPDSYRGTAGEKYYQTVVEIVHSGEGGSTVNITEYISARGTSLALKATVLEGYEFVGWFANGVLISEEESFLYTPTASARVSAQFDFIRYTLAPVGSAGVTLSDYENRYYGGDAITLSATLRDGYTFDGWYALLASGELGELLTEELSYSFTMPEQTVRIIAVTTPIDYELTVNESVEEAGEVGFYSKLFNVDNSITLEYTTVAGYRFLGWYEGDTLLSASKIYTFDTPARDLVLTAKCELVIYDLTVNSTVGGSTDISAGKHTILDTVTLTATENKTYDFVGWYVGGRLYSYESTITFKMPPSDYTLEARFELGHVNINVTSGFNGSTGGNVSGIKDTELTVMAYPDEGYRFVGWYLNGVIVSTDAKYTALYDVSGDYSLYAKFDTEQISVTYYPDNALEPWTEKIDDISAYLTPYLYKEGYRFDGWYTDKDTFASPLSVGELLNNTDAFAKWTPLSAINEAYTGLSVPYAIEIYSRLPITEANVSERISIVDSNGEPIAISVSDGGRVGYYLVSADFAEGATYSFATLTSDVFVTSGINTFVLVFERPEVEEVDYAPDVITFTVDDIKQKKPDNSGLTFYCDKTVAVGDVLYCTNDPDGCLGYVESVTELADGSYDVTFSAEEVDPALVLSRLNVNSKDVELNLENAEIVGDVPEALETFTLYAMDATGVEVLCDQLTTLSAKDKSFSFGEPKAVPNLSLNGNKIEIKVTITVEGERKNDEGEVTDKFSIRVVVGIANTLTSDCDVDVNIGKLSIDNFYFELKNTTEVYFNVDLVYGSGDSEANYDALEMLLVNYKETISEKKELPFDVESKCEETFADIEIPITIPLGATPLSVDITITPFIRYSVIGQLDVNTSFTVTNTCALVYVGGDFEICYNCDTERTVELYALAYCRLEAGINVEASLYISGFKKLLNAFIFFEAGPYVEAAGALIYEDSKVDLAGYVEWGYFYDWGVGVRVLGKTYDYDPDKVSKRLGHIGTYYLYIEFTDDEEEYTVEEYTIEIFKELDHELYAFELDTFNPVNRVGEREDYRYVIEENPYIYVDSFDYLRIRQTPKTPITIDLYIYIGNLAVKTVVLTVDINEYSVEALANSDGFVQADKSFAAIGQSVSFRFVRSSDNVIVRYWRVNGVKVDKPYPVLTVPMVEGGLTVEAITETLDVDVYYIDSVSDFQMIRNNPYATYIQTADIDFDGRYFMALPEFYGEYFGNGYKISNINCRRLEEDENSYYGLFAKATCAKFYGVRVENIYISGDQGSYRTSKHSIYAAGIVAYGEEIAFYDCTVEGISYAIDFSGSAPILCYAKKLTSRYGGICAYSKTSLIMDSCSAIGIDFCSTITSTASSLAIGSPMELNIMGGLVAETANKVLITDCYAEGVLEVDNGWNGDSNIFVGGIIGRMSEQRTSKQSYRIMLDSCLSDVSISQTNGSKKFVSAMVGGLGKNTSTAYIDEQSNGLYTVSERYTLSTSSWDNYTRSFSEQDVYTEDFVYNILGFDPMLWSVVDGRIVKR